MDLTVGKVATHMELPNKDPNKLTIIPKMYVKMGPFGGVCLFQRVDVMFADIVRDPSNHFPINLDKNNLETRKTKENKNFQEMDLTGPKVKIRGKSKKNPSGLREIKVYSQGIETNGKKMG